MKKSNFDRYLEEQIKDPAFAARFERAGEAWEDFYDCAVARSREGEPRESLASVKKRFVRRKRQRG